MLSSALNAAVKRRLVTWNVCAQLDLPPERPERRPVWDAAELSRFLVHVEQDRQAALWRLYAIVGLRRGEVLALRWANVDLDAGSLRVEETLGEVDGKLVWGGPKTTSGKRTISLDKLTVAQLRATREHQDLERATLGDAYQNADLVFCREDGARIWPGTVTKRFGALASEAGLPSIRLHDLRHSAASLARQRRRSQDGQHTSRALEHRHHRRPLRPRAPGDRSRGGREGRGDGPAVAGRDQPVTKRATDRRSRIRVWP